MRAAGWMLIGVMLALPAVCRAAQTTIGALETQFRELPPDARRQTGPLFWLHGDESPERLAMYVGKVAEGGNGCFTTESRPHNDWMGPNWWRDLGICLRAAKQHNLQMWIFDEKWWPSGEVGGKVPLRYSSKTMTASAVSVEGPKQLADAGYGGEGFLAVVAGKENADGSVDGTTLTDVTGFVKEGTLAWEVPAGKWKVMKFGWKYTGGHLLVDGASQDCVDWYIKTVYQPHYDHFKDDFGKTIRGYFYDEPETHGDWGTEVPKLLAERGVDWKKAYVAWKFRLAGEEQVAARYQYQDAFAEAWGRTLYGGLSRWCKAHGVESMGHFLEHGNAYLGMGTCAGNMFQLMKYSDMGGIDAVFDQFVMGKRVTRDNPVWQTPKMGSSISHVYGKRDDVNMVEIFGARGQNLTYPEMKWWADHMQVSGINFLIPHSFNPRAPFDSDCPPYFYDGGYEPRFPLYRVFADYTSRLSVMLTGGRHVCPVALLFLGNSAHAGRAVTPEQISESLQDALYDCDWMPYDAFEQDTAVAGKELRLRQESYRVVVVPPVETIPYATLAKVKQYFDAGGTVVGYGFLPSQSATLGKTAADITALREAVWGAEPKPGLTACRTNAAGGRSYLLPEKPTPEQIQQALAGDAGIHATLEVLEGQTDHWLHVLHRVKAGCDVFFIANQNWQGEPRKFRFRVTAAGVPECWDPLRNEITSVPFKRNGQAVEIDLTLQPLESLLLVLQPTQRPLPARNEGSLAGARIAVAREASPPPAPSAPPVAEKTAFDGARWVWSPEPQGYLQVPPCKRYFRATVQIPAGQIRKAVFRLAADNSAVLFVNGKQAGSSDAWEQPTEIDVAALLRPGANTLAIEAANGGEAPNPAAIIGRCKVEFAQGAPIEFAIDKAWKCSREAKAGWQNAGFDDAGWVAAQEVADFGQGPWGRSGRALTLSPVKADPFAGRFDVPAGKIASATLEVDGLAPEEAARVTINGKYAGGLIGRPLRLEIGQFVKPGANTLLIEPFAPKKVEVLVTR